MINFRLNCAQETFYCSPIEPSKLLRLDWRQRQLGIRFDDLAHMLGLPDKWEPAMRDIGVLILLSQDALDLGIVESIWTGYEQGVHGWRGDKDVDVDLLHRLEQAIGLCEANVTEDVCIGHAELKAEIEKTLRHLNEAWRGLGQSTRDGGLYGGCPGLQFNGWYVLGDAFFIGVANGVGYLLGTAAQTGLERFFCESKELGYGHRVAAELVNRFIQHSVRFAIRDVLMPLVKHKGGLRQLTPCDDKQSWLQFLIAAMCLISADLGGVEIMKKLPTVKKQEDGLPDAWDNGLQMSVFAGTDMVGWMLIGVLSQLCLKIRYEPVEEPFKGLDAKAVAHFCQVVVDGCVVSAWKNAHQTLNPNSRCLPGTGDGLRERAPEYAGFVFALDGGELTAKAVIDLALCVKREYQAPRTSHRQVAGVGTDEERGLLRYRRCQEAVNLYLYKHRRDEFDAGVDYQITEISFDSFKVRMSGETLYFQKRDGDWIVG